jgi:hypothetical protein
MNIIFAFTDLYFSSDLQFKFELTKKIQLNEKNLIVCRKHFYNCAKMKHVSLDSVGTYHKKFGWEKKKNKKTLPSVHGWYSVKLKLPSVGRRTLGKEDALPSVDVRHSAKITTVSSRRLLTTLCRESLFGEWLALGNPSTESPALGKRGR